MEAKSQNPAEDLEGRRLENGWVVQSRFEINRDAGATGGWFSVCYFVESPDGKRAFLKALNLDRALRAKNQTVVVQLITEAFNLEKNLLNKCRQLDHVVQAIDGGSIQVEGSPYAVPYLIFELAGGDVRNHLAALRRFDLAWNLRCLHHVANGVNQLHSIEVAHQDLKPSNVLVFEGKKSKVSDLGRASYIGEPGPFDHLDQPGDPEYAPPEALYHSVGPDWRHRRFGYDLYLLGSMVVFFFTQLSMTALLFKHLPPAFHFSRWRDKYADALPYLEEAFALALDELADNVPYAELRSAVRGVVFQLCHPNPEKRGVPQNIRGVDPPYLLNRYVSIFNLWAERAKLGLLN